MKISIIGTNGFLSSAIARYANDRKWHLTMYGLDTPVNNTYDVFHKINLQTINELEFSGLIDSDIIVYAAGAGIQSNINDDSNLIYALNVSAPIFICNQMKMNGFKGCFVTFGSYFELGETDIRKPASENDILASTANAPTDYIVSKRMLTLFSSLYKHNFTHWHFILPTIYGVGENPKRLIPYTIKAIMNGISPQFTDGNQVRQYLHVSEVAALIHLAIKKHLPSGIYNIEGNATLTIRELVSIIYTHMGKIFPIESFGSMGRDDVIMKYLALDGRKLRDMIGWTPSVDIKNIIDEYLGCN